MTTEKYSPKRKFRRSQVALHLGILVLGIAMVFALASGVKPVELFSGFMAGIGTIGALMAAFESADAAESAADAAKQANELTMRQLTPTLVITGVEFHFQTEIKNNYQAYLYRIAIDNVGATYTACRRINVYVYIEKKRTYCYGASTRIPFQAGSGTEHDIMSKKRDFLKLSNIDGYAIEVYTIHGTIHCSIGWVIHHLDSLYTEQLTDISIPEFLPDIPEKSQTVNTLL